ncbi:glycosyltransferase [Tenacibaculum discolor]|uniref:glycosyltransferase n=1 Tax=Tenacibaculum discolor TaxID=361581 RepID=UPI0027B94BA8|nr:glycosyltransferase family 2 protein [Tenacibaculum discolor]
MLVISGAFGMFDKNIAIKVGGYSTETVGEDMEIVVRMRRYMEEQNKKYKVAYIPDPLCWTEAPESYRTFISQRNRWTRGTIETLKTHRVIGFNPKYRVLGMLSFPYWFLFERLAPIIEVLGIIYFTVLLFIGSVHWNYVLGFFLAAYFSSVTYTLLAIFSEEFSFHQYKKKGVGFQLIKSAFIEPFLLHPVVLYAALKGNKDYYFNKKLKWGKMTRKGLSNK